MTVHSILFLLVGHVLQIVLTRWSFVFISLHLSTKINKTYRSPGMKALSPKCYVLGDYEASLNYNKLFFSNHSLQIS